MPVLKLAPHIDQLRGTVRGTIAPGMVYFDSGAGNPPRSRVWRYPVQPDTPPQIAARSVHAANARAYALLSEANRESWVLFGHQLLDYVTDRFGNPHYLSGIAAFCRCNDFAVLTGASRHETAPANDGIAPGDNPGRFVSAVSVTVDEPLTTVVVVLAFPFPAVIDFGFAIRLSNPLPGNRQGRPNDVFFPLKTPSDCTDSVAAAAPSASLELDVADAVAGWTPPAVGDRVAVQVVYRSELFEGYPYIHHLFPSVTVIKTP